MGVGSNLIQLDTNGVLMRREEKKDQGYVYPRERPCEDTVKRWQSALARWVSRPIHHRHAGLIPGQART